MADDTNKPTNTICKPHDPIPTWRMIVAWLLTLTGLTITVTANVTIEVNTTPETARHGWAGPDAVAEAEEVRESLPRFQIRGAAQDNAKRVVRLWDAVRKVLGKDTPNYPQEIGDCVSFGAKNAIEYLQCSIIAGLDNLNVFGEPELGEAGGATGPPVTEFQQVSTSYLYGTGRVLIGKRQLGRGDGSTGIWQAKGAQEYGAVTLEEAGGYSGAQAKDWGYNGPPQRLLDLGKQRLVRTVAPVRTPAEVRDAICNGYPVTIASNFGTRTFLVIDGKRVAKGDDRWSHQMCIVAYDGSGSQPYWYVLNSWGGPAHPAPLQGEPVGGFWITERQLKSILAENDSFAYSAFDGFPARELNFNIFGADGPKTVDAGPPPTINVPLMGVDPMTGTGSGISLMGLGCFAGFFRRRKNGAAGRVIVASLLFAMMAFRGTAAQAAEPVFNVFGSPVADPMPEATFNVFAPEPEPLAQARFSVFEAEKKSCQCLETGVCDCGENCPCTSREEPVTDYVEFHTRAGCGPCERFKRGPLKALASWKWQVGPHGHVRVITHPADWPEAVPQFRFYRNGKEFARKTGFMDEWKIAEEFARRETTGRVRTKSQTISRANRFVEPRYAVVSFCATCRQ